MGLFAGPRTLLVLRHLQNAADWQHGECLRRPRGGALRISAAVNANKVQYRVLISSMYPRGML